MAILTPIQFKRSLALAYAYGHLWAHEMANALDAECVTQIDPDKVTPAFTLYEAIHGTPPDTYSLRDLEIEDTCKYLDTDLVETISMSSDAWKRLPGGIRAPRVDDYGTVVYTTGSGRLTWCVEPDGVTTLTISRPCGDVLRAVVAFDRYSYLEVLDPQNICHRHVSALMDALNALSEQITWQSGDHGVNGLDIFEQTERLYSSIVD